MKKLMEAFITLLGLGGVMFSASVIALHVFYNVDVTNMFMYVWLLVMSLLVTGTGIHLLYSQKSWQ
jgi:hypothetical protein